jgi:hypothetical protein
VGNDAAEVRNENLPYPVVKYPTSGGFIAFKPSEDTAKLFFCSCAREALENFIDCQIIALEDSHQDVTPANVLQHSVPDDVIDRVRDAGVTDVNAIIDVLNFADEVCHKCNDGVVPKLRYCHDMYGTVFKQNYGWYVQQKYYEFGVCRPGSDTLLTHTEFDKLPGDVVDLVDDDLIETLEAKATRFEELREKRWTRRREINETKKEKLREVNNELGDELGFREKWDRSEEIREKYENMDPLAPDEQAELDALKEELAENSQRIADAVENEVRQAVGHYEKGDRWTSETILYHLVEAAYGDEFTIERHHRPDWLDGLELDIFLSEPGIGIEYQGVQHYEAVEHWGGEEALEERQARDERTRELCDEHDVELVEIRHNEELSEELVESRIDPLL